MLVLKKKCLYSNDIQQLTGILKKLATGNGEIPQQLRVLSVLPEYPGWILSIKMIDHNHL